MAPAHNLKPPGYAWDALKKEIVVQLAKQLALLGARGMNTDGLWSITSSAGAARMRPSTGCNLPWPCTVRLDRPLAPGWFWTKRRCSCWKCMISCFRTENLENKPFWNLSSCPGPQDNQCCQEGRELSNRLGGGGRMHIISLPAQLAGDHASCQHEYGRSTVGNGPGRGQTETRAAANFQTWAAEPTALQDTWQGPYGVNRQRCQDATGALGG